MVVNRHQLNCYVKFETLQIIRDYATEQNISVGRALDEICGLPEHSNCKRCGVLAGLREVKKQLEDLL